MNAPTEIELNLNGTPLVLTAAEAIDLADLTRQPGWAAFMRVMEGIDAGTRAALEDPETELDKVRALQGRLGVTTDVKNLLSEGIPAWVKAMS